MKLNEFRNGSALQRSAISLLLLLAFSACGPQKNSGGVATGPETTTSASTSGGDETRGGGDGCEISYKYHMRLALDWIFTQQVLMTAEEWRKANEVLLPLETPPMRNSAEPQNIIDYSLLRNGSLEIKCGNDPIYVNGEPKTAATRVFQKSAEKSAMGLKFSTTIDFGKWFLQPRDLRSSLACHEAMVMAGVEKTNDYHICQNMLQQRLNSLPLKELECSHSLSGTDLLTMRIVSEKTGVEGRVNSFSHSIILELRRRSYVANSWQQLQTVPPVFSMKEKISRMCWFSGTDPIQLECAGMDPNSLIMQQLASPRDMDEGHRNNYKLNLDASRLSYNWYKLEPAILKEPGLGPELSRNLPLLSSPEPWDVSDQFAECKTKYFVNGEDGDGL